MPSTPEEFDRQGYAVVQSIVDRSQVAALYKYSMKLAANGQLPLQSRQVRGAPAAYADPFMEGLLERLRPKIEQAAGRRLFATYSYLRVYRNGDELRRHKDRAACEISVSLCLGYLAESPWPLFVEGPQGVFAAALQPGDGVLYKGVECAHWREPFTGESASQVFLHYVDQDGPFAEWKHDKRASLGRFKADVPNQPSSSEK